MTTITDALPEPAESAGDPLDHAWHVLALDCDLPATECELLKVLDEYRAALHNLATHVKETRDGQH